MSETTPLAPNAFFKACCIGLQTTLDQPRNHNTVKIGEVTRELLRAEYAAGVPVREIAERHKVAENTVYKYVRWKR